MKNKMIKLPLFLAAVTAICTILLGLTYQLTITQIKKDEDFRANAAYGEIYETANITFTEYDDVWVAVADLSNAKYSNIIVSDKEVDGKKSVAKIIKNGSDIVGYSVIATGVGFKSGAVRIMLGFNENAELIGLKVLDVTTQSAGYGADFAAANEAALLAYLKANPNTGTLSKAENVIMSGSTVTVNALVSAYISGYSLVKEIKG